MRAFSGQAPSARAFGRDFRNRLLLDIQRYRIGRRAIHLELQREQAFSHQCHHCPFQILPEFPGDDLPPIEGWRRFRPDLNERPMPNQCQCRTPNRATGREEGLERRRPLRHGFGTDHCFR